MSLNILTVRGQGGVLNGMQQTLTAGSALATSFTSAVQALDTFVREDYERMVAIGEKPADIWDIRALMIEVSQEV
jgi:hypothetical protein